MDQTDMGHNQRVTLPVEKTLWYVESHLFEEIRLARLAELCEVSPTYLSRVFPLALGITLKAYLRRRRLSEAARRLAEGAPDILAVALDHGYGSHEAFTRSFREEFGVTPESVRSQGHVHHLCLLEAVRMNTEERQDLQPVRIEISRSLLVGGLCQHYEGDTAGIPAQWLKSVPYLGNLTGQVGDLAYGVCFNFAEGGAFDYLCGVEVVAGTALPAGWQTISLPAQQTYAVFRHEGHVALVRHTFRSIFEGWLPGSGYLPGEAPSSNGMARNLMVEPATEDWKCGCLSTRRSSLVGNPIND